MEIKKSLSADLEGKKGTGLLMGFVLALSAMFVAFEWTQHDKKVIETEPVFTAAIEEDMIPQIIRSLNRDTFGASHMRRLSRVNLSAMQTYASDFNDQRQIRKKAYHRFFQDASIFLHTTYICLSMIGKSTVK